MIQTTHIGKYEILAELGRGGMGVVFRASDKSIGREVAIKQLLDATPELRQRFLVEARSGVLNHQNIVTVYDFGEQDGNPYIVMEFLSGETLDSILKGGRQLSLVEKLEIVLQVCNGLGYAHQKGVVHRDIKPANIMVQPGGTIKIVDFGIARLESASGETKTGSVIGTFHYISPERLKGEASDGRGDIWAVGVMLYLMLTGFLPFAGEDVSALHKVVNEPFLPLSDFLPEYPPGLDEVLNRALAKDPDDRYANADEMAADVEAINDTLKRSRVDELLARVHDLIERSELKSARPMLLDLLRMDPQNIKVKGLLRTVQEKLSQQSKAEQLEQVVRQAGEAVRALQFAEALELYKQAAKIDPSNQGLPGKIDAVREMKEKQEKVAMLRKQARESLQRNDLSVASHLIQRALQLDPANEELREEQTRMDEGVRQAAAVEPVPEIADGGFTQLFRHINGENSGNNPERTFSDMPGGSGGETVILTSGAAKELLWQDKEAGKEQPASLVAPQVEQATEGSFTQMFSLLVPAGAGPSEPRSRDVAVRPQVVLTFTSSSDTALTGRSVPITRLPFVIGRDRDSDLCITSDRLLSRQHCTIDWVDGAYVVRDLGSSNGTWLNGRRLGERPAILQFGSVVRFSNATALTFVSVDLLELPDLTGCVVGGRFKLEELIRSSKKSALYRGEDQRLPQSVAVKVLSPDLAIYPGYLEQFNREAETAARMRHPNIAKVIDFGLSTLKAEGFAEFQAQYVCTDFMQGGSLASRIAERKFMPMAEVEAWLIPIGDALSQAHRQGVIHSALKSTSVVFDGESTPYLTDFAVATQSSASEGSWLLGAPEFMAPEQWEGCVPTHWTDQYSLAVLAYYSVAGARPYEGQLDPDMRQRNFERGPSPVHEEARRNGNVGVPAALSAVLARALATKVESRYGTIGEFCVAFSEALAQRSASAQPNVFLSYRRDVSSGWVSLFAGELKRAGMTVFVDVNRQDNAVVFPQWLEKAISKCDVFICFLAKGTLSSNWVREEIRIAHQHQKLMIPIFQEGFKRPDLLTRPDQCVEMLLTYQGVTLLDRQNIYIDAAVQHLALMIQASIRS